MSNYTFIDLFAGIGGIRIAFERAGAECVFTSEWDKFAQQTYKTNFGEFPHGDITQIQSNEIPDHDILLAGFPCQPFSISGVSKKNSLGKAHGFADKTQGNLFFEIARILRDKQPQAFLLENVKHLVNHDKGRTFTIIQQYLTEMGYTYSHKIVDARHYVPQHRERIYIVGFRNDLFYGDEFDYPPDPTERLFNFTDILENDTPSKYTLSDHQWSYQQAYKEKHRLKGNGFGFGLVQKSQETVTRTLSARYFKDGSEILIDQPPSNPRRLTPRECARLMGFPDDFIIPVSDTQAYRQFGNSVAIPVVEAVAQQLVDTLNRIHSYTMSVESTQLPLEIHAVSAAR